MPDQTSLTTPAPTGRPAGEARTARGRATRHRIVTAAATLIHAHGVAGTSLDDILETSGTSKSQLYHYFADKSDLVRAVVDEQIGQILQAQRPELDAMDSMDGLRRWRDRVIELHEDDQSLGCPLGRLANELTGDDPESHAALTNGFTLWKDRLAHGLAIMEQRGQLQAGADSDALALGMLAALQGGLLLARTSGTTRPLEAALDLALAGIPTKHGINIAP